MSEVERIADQLRRSFERDAWHGPAVLEALDGVTAAQAARRPLPAAHSIWELVNHCVVWKDFVRRRVSGEMVKVALGTEEDWPPLPEPPSEAAWREAVDRLRRAHEALLEMTRGLGDQALDVQIPGTSFTAYVLLHGAVQHDLYHAGQISLLKKGSL